ncbi:hypothetical protein CHARACLAT_014148 [Characodon lateralis]|uniref:Uncharacterized protein n=1 Tax=Characodon lateralis TaxID=208331 RepID=A0ABU7CNW4_9TELE|nr:hypothetical protein [Characodon lateralis]
MAPRTRPARAQGDHGGAHGSRPVRSAQSGRRFPRPSGGPPVMFFFPGPAQLLGYLLQFRRRPPIPSRAKMTVICNLMKAQALDREICTLVAMGAIVPMDPLWDPGVFIQFIFWFPRRLASGV